MGGQTNYLQWVIIAVVGYFVYTIFIAPRSIVDTAGETVTGVTDGLFGVVGGVVDTVGGLLGKVVDGVIFWD